MNKRYSTYMKPISTILDLLILNLLFYYLIILPGYILKPNYGIDVSMYPRFFIVINIGWLIIAYILDLYKIFRFTRFIKILRALSNQILIFSLLISALFAWSYLLLNKIAIMVFIISLVAILFNKRYDHANKAENSNEKISIWLLNARRILTILVKRNILYRLII
jgi:hypothetical protein